MRSYTELSESLGESKIQVFGFVYDRLNNMINDWIFKFFTKRRKEEILRITALPNHVMSYYRLPKTTAKKLTIAII